MSDGKKRMLRSLAFGIGAGLLVCGLRATASLAQEPTADATIDPGGGPPAPAAAPAPAPAAPEPKGPDPTGATTGTAADVPVKDAANPTLAEVMETVGHNKIAINIVWTLITGFLVMFMQAGFAMVETGFTRAKNAAHTMRMNFMVYPIGMLGLLGLRLRAADGRRRRAWPRSAARRRSTTSSRSPCSARPSACSARRASSWAATSTTSASSRCSCSRWCSWTRPRRSRPARWPSAGSCRRSCVYGFFMSMVVYPIFGNWVWGGGWLADARRELRPRPRPRRLRRLVGRAHGRRRRRAGRRDRARPAHRQVHEGRQAGRDPRPQHPDGDRRHVHPGVRLVRLQPGLDAGRHRPAHRASSPPTRCSPAPAARSPR